jgi:hydrogenase maturation factor
VSTPVTELTFDFSPRSGATCDSDHCITCGDDGIPMIVLATDDDRGLALCDDNGLHASVETALVAPVIPGDLLLVHAGTAIFHLTRDGGRG